MRPSVLSFPDCSILLQVRQNRRSPGGLDPLAMRLIRSFQDAMCGDWMKSAAEWTRSCFNRFRYAGLVVQRAIWHRYRRPDPSDDRALDSEVDAQQLADQQAQTGPPATQPVAVIELDQVEPPTYRLRTEKMTTEPEPAPAASRTPRANGTSRAAGARRAAWPGPAASWQRIRSVGKRATTWEFATATGIIAALLALFLLLTTDLGSRRSNATEGPDEGEPALAALPATETQEPEPSEPLEPEASPPVTSPPKSTPEGFPELDLSLFEDPPRPAPTQPASPQPEVNPFEVLPPATTEVDPVSNVTSSNVTEESPSAPPIAVPPELEAELSLQLIDPEPVVVVESVPMPLDINALNPLPASPNWASSPDPSELATLDHSTANLPPEYRTPDLFEQIDASQLYPSQEVVTNARLAAAISHQDVEVIRQAVSTANRHQLHTCQLLVRNKSAETIPVISLRESLPDSIAVVDARPTATWIRPQLEWSLLEVKPQEERIVTYRYYGIQTGELQTETAVSVHTLVTASTQVEMYRLSLTMQATESVSSGQFLPIRFQVHNAGELSGENLTLRLHLPAQLHHPLGQTLDHEISQLKPKATHAALIHAEAKQVAQDCVLRAEILNGDQVLDEFEIQVEIVNANRGQVQPTSGTQPKTGATPRQLPLTPCPTVIEPYAAPAGFPAVPSAVYLSSP